jgi:hypothetical protein
MTPEQFDLYIKEKNLELTEAWKAIPPKETEVMTKAIIDYQYKATMALLNAIQQMNSINNNRNLVIMSRLDEIENEIKKQK